MAECLTDKVSNKNIYLYLKKAALKIQMIEQINTTN